MEQDESFRGRLDTRYPQSTLLYMVLGSWQTVWMLHRRNAFATASTVYPFDALRFDRTTVESLPFHQAANVSLQGKSNSRAPPSQRRSLFLDSATQAACCH